MSKGYLILAQNNPEFDYLKLAYINALTIRLTQTKVNSVSLVTDVVDAVPHHYKEVFDNIIQIPWFDDALNSQWKIENRWKLYYASPYQETVILDADMLFLSDVSYWWDYLSTREICITSRVKNFRNEFVDIDKTYRNTFILNDIPNTYSAFAYFKKCLVSKDFWDLVDVIVKNWEEYYISFLPLDRPKRLSIDVVFGLALKLLDMKDIAFTKQDFPTFVHMKSHVQGWKHPSTDWTECVSPYFSSDGSLKIGNYQQTGIFHYTEKKIITDEILYLYEDLYRKKNAK